MTREDSHKKIRMEESGEPSAQDEECWLFLLPVELKCHILEFLEPSDVVVCSRVCHEWNELCNDQYLWKMLLKNTSTWHSPFPQDILDMELSAQEEEKMNQLEFKMLKIAALSAFLDKEHARQKQKKEASTAELQRKIQVVQGKLSKAKRKQNETTIGAQIVVTALIGLSFYMFVASTIFGMVTLCLLSAFGLRDVVARVVNNHYAASLYKKKNRLGDLNDRVFYESQQLRIDYIRYMQMQQSHQDQTQAVMRQIDSLVSSLRSRWRNLFGKKPKKGKEKEIRSDKAEKNKDKGKWCLVS